MPLYLQGHQQVLNLQNLSIANIGFLFEEIAAEIPTELPVWCIIHNTLYFETSYRGWVTALAEIVECSADVY